MGIKQIRTRHYTPSTNGKAERFIQTLYREWSYGMPFQNSGHATVGSPATCRSITGSENTKPAANSHLSSACIRNSGG